jgi:hypothetical protein
MHEQKYIFLKQAVNALNNPSAIKQISHHVKKYYGLTLKICYPKESLDKSKIYFLVEKHDFDTAVVKAALKRILRLDTQEVDEQDFVFLNEQMINPLNLDALVGNVTILHPSSVNKVIEFLHRNYGQLLENKSQEHQMRGSNALHL